MTHRCEQPLSFNVVGIKRVTLLVFTALFFLGTPAPCADADRKSLDKEFLSGFMEGEYDLIGRKPDSTTAYTGRVSLRSDGDTVQVTRTIEGKTTKATMHFDTIAGADRFPVLRMRFILDGMEHEATYRWQTDPDNYPRFTGIIYRPGSRTKSPGLEALFPIHK